MRFSFFLIVLILHSFSLHSAVEVYTPMEMLIHESPAQFGKKLDKESRRALRKEFKKARKEAKATKKKNPKGLAIGGFISTLLSFMMFFSLGTTFLALGVLFYAAGIVLSAISLSRIRDGRMDKKYKWMPVISLIIPLILLAVGVVVLLFIGLFSLIG